MDFSNFILKCGFCKKSFIMNAPLVSWAYLSSLLGGFAVGQAMPFIKKYKWNTQMPITLDDASKEKSIKFSILLPLRAISFHTLQYETPCESLQN